VKTVLDSMPTYIFTALKPPRKFYKELDRIRRCFLCAGNQQLQDGKWKVIWARVYHPTKLGCSGIRDHEKFGRALRIHWLWFQWKCLDTPWCQFDLPVDVVNKALFAAATLVTVHNGKTAKFWQSSLLDSNAPTTMFPTLYSHSKRKNRTVVNALENNNWIRPHV
jgi:hypothetical protein